MSHSKNQGNPNLIDKRKPSDYNSEMTVLELRDKDFKSVIIKIFQQAITNTLETNKNKVSAKK